MLTVSDRKERSGGVILNTNLPVGPLVASIGRIFTTSGELVTVNTHYISREFCAEV